MKFIITYSCDGLGTEQLAVEAESEDIVLDYAYHSALEYREGYVGLHDCVDYPEFCEEEVYDIDSDDAADAFNDMVENEIEYFVETYNENDETHRWILMDCNGKFWEI